MRWFLLALVLLLGPGLVMAASSPGAEGSGSAGSSGGSAATPKPGAWPPPADNTTVSQPSSNFPVTSPYDASPSGPAARDWASYKGDPQRTGATSSPLPVRPVKRWDAGSAGPGVFAPPVVSRGLVVFGGLDHKARAVDAATGFAVWNTELSAMVIAGPAASDDKVIVATVDGVVHALDLRNGSLQWRVNLDGKTTAAPLVFNGVVYVAAETGRVLALNVGDGKIRWNRTFGTFDELVAPMLVANRLILGDTQGLVTALNPLTGQTLWTANVGAPVTATPVGAGGRIVVPTLGLKALEPETGRVQWTKTFGAFVRSSPAFSSNTLVYGDPEGPYVIGASALTGEQLWRTPTRLFVRAAPAIAGDNVLVAAADGTMFALKLRNGSLVWTLDPLQRMAAPPVVFDGRVLAARMDGLVRLFADPAAPVSAGFDDSSGGEGASNGNPLMNLLPLAVLILPYVGLKQLRARVARREETPASPMPLPPKPVRTATGGFLRVACPKCACKFGIQPREQRVVECPGCGVRSEVRTKRAPQAGPRSPGGLGASGTAPVQVPRQREL